MNIFQECSKDYKDLDKATEHFLKRLNKVLYKCFRKIGIKKKRRSEQYYMAYKRWKEIKSKTDPQSKMETKEIEEKLAKKYFNEIEEAAKDIECDEGGVTNQSIWDLKKKTLS